MLRVLRFLQTVDRRFLYALLMLVVVTPFFINFQLPARVSTATRRLYDTIESLPEGSFVLLGVDWGAGTRGESRPHTEALIHHLMRKRLRFALLAFDPQGKKLAQNIALRLQEQYGYREGVHWVNFGYKVDQENYLKAFGPDIIGTVKQDIHGNPLGQLEVMKGIKNANDIALLLDVTGSSTYETYIQFLQGPYKLKMGLGTTSVMAPEAFNRLDAGQLVGLIPGLAGATEYERLLGIPGKGTRATNSSNAAHLLVITFILLGNLAMVMERRLRAQGGAL
ncbi:MAG: hypothetical protein RMJ43_01320 [Chloroherpetonaceae bacterium]|nr:hypothetical protein [Chthonomonadaceae bacterium]MDW8206448.1 hypothetical protein [Chloroherpetonaceae bacterium]